MHNDLSTPQGQVAQEEIPYLNSDDIRFRLPSSVFESAPSVQDRSVKLHLSETVADEFSPLQLLSTINLEETTPLDFNAKICVGTPINQARLSSKRLF